MLVPELFTENLFDNWFDDFGLEKEMNRLNATLLYREHQLNYMQITYLRRILEDDASISIVSLKKKGYILQVR